MKTSYLMKNRMQLLPKWVLFPIHFLPLAGGIKGGGKPVLYYGDSILPPYEKSYGD
ncbi:MAG: hypothetical protein JXL81_05035 [Deltaproteobacteria bacterium]|nr:hypothetical protein [Deltaproteobacteria bacterium]